MSETNTGASGLERVWARHLHGEVEPKQGLSTGRIVAAAVEIADADGLGAVSMSRVAARLGFTTMSLYRHVTGKDELVLLMMDAAVGPPPPDAVPAGEWRAALRGWAWAILAAFRSHPWLLAAITVTGPPATPHQLAWLELGLGALADTGLTEQEKLSTVLLIDAHVFSDLQFSAAGAETGGDSGYAGSLAAVLDPDRFPALLRALRGGAFADAATERDPDGLAGRDRDFAYGLDRILDGVERLVHDRSEP